MTKNPIVLARKIVKKCLPKKPCITETRLMALSSSCEEYISKHNIKTKLKVLWPTPFNLDKNWWAHDGVLTWALRVRGVDIIPTMCDRLQSNECVFYGGVWQNSNQQGFQEKRDAICQNCINRDLKLWHLLKLTPLHLSSFITYGEKKEIETQVKQILKADWENALYEDFPIGKEAWKAVINSMLQGEIKESWREQGNALASQHLFNIIALKKAYERILHVIEPDRVVGNGGYYYFWGIINHLVKQVDISYFRYYSIGLQPMSWNYARNTNELVDLTPAWSSWIRQPWSNAHEAEVEEDLRLRGLYLNSNDEALRTRINQAVEKIKIDPNKRTLLLLAGVIWDANTNIVSESFGDMYEWILATITWFADHPDFQLLIKIHPGENAAPSIGAKDRSFLINELAQMGAIPANVYVIKPEDQIDSYDLMHLAHVGATYMSTTGLEFSCFGKPLIAIGPVHYSKKGFTYDPCSKENYFLMLASLLSKNTEEAKTEEIKTLAMKYWYLYAFHVSTVTGLFEINSKNWAFIKRGIDDFTSHLKPISVADILPGANEYIDYFCDAVMNDLPILGENRWPPKINKKYCQM